MTPKPPAAPAPEVRLTVRTTALNLVECLNSGARGTWKVGHSEQQDASLGHERNWVARATVKATGLIAKISFGRPHAPPLRR